MSNNSGKTFGRPAKDRPSAKRHPEQTQAEALAHPGLAVRVAAAAIISDIVQGGHTLDEDSPPTPPRPGSAALTTATAPSPAPW